MTPQQKKTTTESIELYKQTLQGKNFSPHSLKAYIGDIEQFMEWLKKRVLLQKFILIQQVVFCQRT